MNRFIYKKLFFPLFFLTLTTGYSQVTLVNSGSSTFCLNDTVTLSVPDAYVSYLW